MIAILAITVLLGSTVVQSAHIDCADAQQMIRDKIKCNADDVTPIPHNSQFGNEITFEHVRPQKGFKNHENSFGVVQSQNNLPSINLHGKSYKLLAFSILPIDLDEGVAALLALFSHDGYNAIQSAVGVHVPLILCDGNDEVGFNGEFDSDLSILSTLPPDSTHKMASLQWFEPLLGAATSISRPNKKNIAFMTECVKVSRKNVSVFFKPVEERPFVTTSFVAAIQPTNFGETVRVERADDSQPKNTFIVKQSEKDIPRVTLQGKSYNMHSFRVLPFDSDGVGTLAVIFSPEGIESPESGLTIIVPVVALDEYLSDFNENLNEDLEALGRLSPQQQFDLCIVWLQDKLEKATVITGPSTRKLFMVDNEVIFEDALKSYH